MRLFFAGVVLVVCSACTAHAQRPDSTIRHDSITRARAERAAAADSVRLVRELERMSAGTAGNASPAQAAGASGGPPNPRLLPDFSAVGDFVGDLSPMRSTQDGGARLGVREVELAVQAIVDPYFRGDIFLGLNDVEKVSIEQAFLTSTALPYGLEVRLGRFLMPVGKQNTTHRHDLHAIEYPWVIQRFLSPDGLKGTGASVSKIFAPFGFYQEVQLAAVDRFGEATDGLTPDEPVNKSLRGLGYSARVRNYLDLSESSNVELAASAITGQREQSALSMPSSPATSPVNSVNARQTVVGADFTFRWRPLRQGLYRSFVLQTEVMRQINERHPALPIAVSYAGPARDVNGAYVFGRYQIGQRAFIGSRYDYVGAPDPGLSSFNAVSGYLEFFPSEFSKLVAGVERVLQGGRQVGLENRTNRFLVQASFALGPHKPHPF